MMAKKLTPEQQQELEQLARKTLLVFDFMVEEGCLFPGAEAFRGDLERARDQGNLRGMRMAWRDSCEWIDDLPPEKQRRLEALLESTLDVTLESARAELEAQILAIRRRQAILSEDEYRLVSSHLERVQQDTARFEERGELQGLVDDFERRIQAAGTEDVDET